LPCSSSAAIFTQRTLCGSPMCASICARVSLPAGDSVASAAGGGDGSRVSTSASRAVANPIFFHATIPPSITATNDMPAHSSCRAASAARRPPFCEITTIGVPSG
jgi:hypothetical protein